jgi:L-threonylcarbamoyladenylate synthase
MTKKTLVLPVDPQNPSKQSIKTAAAFVKKGGLVSFPTETVYGLGADALNSEAVLDLFKAKKRPLDNPPIVHVSKTKDVQRLVVKIPPMAVRLMKELWPGPLTLIFKRSGIVPPVTVAGLDTIAIRMPKHNVALALIRESGCPIAAPSANLAGKPSPTSAKHVLDDLEGRIDAVLDAGPTQIGLESTVLDLTIDPPQILRPGGTSFERLKSILGKVELNPAAVAEEAVSIGKARSPGMKHKHYAPDADMIIVEGTIQNIVRKVRALAESFQLQNKRVGILATDETINEYDADAVKSLGSRKDMMSIARNLFKLLREFDSEDVDVIIAEAFPVEGIGLAVMNRLRKAAGYNIIKAKERSV